MPSTAPEKIDVTIRLDRSMAGEVDRIVGELKANGLSDVQTHVRFMVVNGRVAPAGLDALRAIGGVLAVRQDSVYKV